MTDHECPAFNCGVRVPRSKLACPKHWAMVSEPTKQRVFAAYRNRRRDLGAHYEALSDAVDEILDEQERLNTK